MMSPGLLLVSIIYMGLVTFGLRFVLIGFSDQIAIPQLVRDGLKYVPTAVLSAIVFPDVFWPGGELNLELFNPYLLSAIVATVVAVYSKNVFYTMLVGLLALWGVQYLIG